MGFFSYAQGQLTLQSLVRSGRISNSSEMLWMFSLPASMKKIRSKMKALECWQHFPHYNPMVAMETSGRIWPNFELIQALMHVLIACKYEKYPIKNSGENVMASARCDHWFPWQQIGLQWEKQCHHIFSNVFDQIHFILAGNDDIHKSLNELEIRRDLTMYYGVGCP